MKKFELTKVMLLILIIVIMSLPSIILAAQYKGFVEFGGMKFTERGICEGHKSWTNTGLSIEWGDEMFKWMLTGKLGGMFEPVDDDPELPQCFTHLSIESNYNSTTDRDLIFFPFAKISYDRWLRNENSKYEDSFSKLSLISGTLGVGMRYKNFYTKLGGSLPVLIKTNGNDLSSEVGFNAIIGIEWRRLDFGLLYEQVHLDGIQSNLYGLRVEINFKERGNSK
jgi:hypothetical protein